MSISVGAVGTASTVVTPENTAAAVGSGALPVFATPYMIALFLSDIQLSVKPDE